MKKLRPFYPAEQLRDLYAHPYDHTRWEEHKSRVKRTIEIAQQIVDDWNLQSVADFSAGDGAIVNGIDAHAKFHSDFTTSGVTIEEGTKIMKNVDLFVCSETIEHLEAPWTVLEQISRKSRFIVLSTPLEERYPSDNWEHYWSFTLEDVKEMLKQSGFTDLSDNILFAAGWNYTYQVWTGKSEHF